MPNIDVKRIAENWTVYTEVDEDGFFRRHAASIGYQNGIAMSFSIWLDGTVTMRLSNNDWRLRDGADFNMTYKTYDSLGQREGYLHGAAANGKTIKFDIVIAGQHFLTEIRRAYSIDVDIDGLGSWNDLDLTGSSAALREVAYRADEIVAGAHGGSPRPVSVREITARNLSAISSSAEAFSGR
jgi:hypothetical protein